MKSIWIIVRRARAACENRNCPVLFVIRDIELNDRARWEPLWRAYSRPIPEEVTEMTWRRFFDGLEPVHALIAEEGR